MTKKNKKYSVKIHFGASAWTITASGQVYDLNSMTHKERQDAFQILKGAF